MYIKVIIYNLDFHLCMVCAGYNNSMNCEKKIVSLNKNASIQPLSFQRATTLYFSCRFIIYMVFLLVMSLSFFIDNNKDSLNHYKAKLDYFRAFCEIVTLLIAFVHLLSEFDQMEKYVVFLWTLLIINCINQLFAMVFIRQ